MIRQENNIPYEDRQKRRDQLSAKHKHAEALAQRIKGWKEWIGQESFWERRGPKLAMPRHSAAGARKLRIAMSRLSGVLES